MLIGQKLRNARENLELSQEQVASLIPMNQSSYSKIERDVQEPSLDQLRQICLILKISPNYLLELEEVAFSSEKDLRFALEIKKLFKSLYK
ncbi:MAG: helix-turn-helix transcriptional regulator [Clostridia bacterium]|nr:helix-turn-helix transcriptional regulator [Clostridia bacterium]MBR6603171.1 helix-turn-helix transcriptional regulator [Clostridia bacterium]